jgi:hypothetical protein
MTKVEVKPNTVTTPCVCGGRNARHRIVITGTVTNNKVEIPLCDDCFKKLKETICLSQ